MDHFDIGARYANIRKDKDYEIMIEILGSDVCDWFWFSVCVYFYFYYGQKIPYIQFAIGMNEIQVQFIVYLPVQSFWIKKKRWDFFD